MNICDSFLFNDKSDGEPKRIPLYAPRPKRYSPEKKEEKKEEKRVIIIDI